MFVSRNPANGETWAELPAWDDSRLEPALALGQECYRSWSMCSFEQRSKVLHRFADLLEAEKEELALLITREMGKRIAESHSELRFCRQITRFYADRAADVLADQPLPSETAQATLCFQPLGLLLGIMPWNFPFYQVVRFATPNLMAGNTVVVKHAPQVPQCAARIESLWREAGLPNGAYQNLPISIEQASVVIADPRVQGVSLTGSERAGSAVAQQAGQAIKKSVLELGGNDPFIVLEDADMELTLDAAVRGRLRNAGQSCVASKRYIVVESLFDSFLEQFRRRFEATQVGDPEDPKTELGPLSSMEALERLEEQVQQAVTAGARVVTGGGRLEGPGAYYRPTILTGVTPESPIFDAELFGPVAVVYRVADEEVAIALANDSSFGLGGSVYTKDVQRGERVCRAVESGMMFVNEPTRSQTQLPFGGIKRSGYGRELSHLALLEFVNQKLIHVPRSE